MQYEELLLVEGIKYFKKSPKIERTINIFEKKLSKLRMTDKKREILTPILKNLKSLYNDFSELELKYKKTKNKELKKEYRILQDKNKILLRKVNSEEIKRTLKILGLFAIVISSVVAITNAYEKTEAEPTEDLREPKPTEEEPNEPIIGDFEIEESPPPFIEGEDDSEFIEKPKKISFLDKEAKRVTSGGVRYASMTPVERGDEKENIVDIIKARLKGKDPSIKKEFDMLKDNPEDKKELNNFFKKNIEDAENNKNPAFDKMQEVLNKKVSLEEKIAIISKRENVDPRIIDAIIKKESSYRPEVKSSNGLDLGLMQLNSKYLSWFKEKFWYEEYDGKFDIFDPEDNAKVGIRYFKYLLKMFKGNEKLALQAYNAGPTAVKRGRVPKSAIRYALDALAKKARSKIV